MANVKVLKQSGAGLSQMAASDDLVGMRNLTASGALEGGSLTDGTLSIASGAISSGASAAFSGQVSAGTLTDGAFSVNSGAVTGMTTASMSGALTLSANSAAITHSGSSSLAISSTNGTVSVESVTFTGAAISGASTIGASGAITGGSLTDGTATLSSGSVSGGVAATFSGAVQGGSLTDGTATLSSGALSGVTTLAASGAATLSSTLAVTGIATFSDQLLPGTDSAKDIGGSASVGQWEELITSGSSTDLEVQFSSSSAVTDVPADDITHYKVGWSGSWTAIGSGSATDISSGSTYKYRFEAPSAISYEAYPTISFAKEGDSGAYLELTFSSSATITPGSTVVQLTSGGSEIDVASVTNPSGNTYRIVLDSAQEKPSSSEWNPSIKNSGNSSYPSSKELYTDSGFSSAAAHRKEIQSGGASPAAVFYQEAGAASYKFFRDVFVGEALRLKKMGSAPSIKEAGTDSMLFTIDVASEPELHWHGADEGSALQLTSNGKIHAGALEFASTSALQDNSGLDLKSSLAGDGLTMTSQVLDIDAAQPDITTMVNLAAVGTSGDDVDFAGNVIVSENLTVQGSLTITGDIDSYNVTVLDVADKEIRLNSGQTGSAALDAAIVAERGDDADSKIKWNETSNKWEQDRAGTATVIPISTAELAEVTNLYYTEARWDSKMASADTDDLSEGSSNQYHTTARARGAISVTDSGGDGSLAYNSTSGVITYTGPSAAEVRAHLSAGEGIDISSGEISGEDASDSNKGIASFASADFSVSSGAVSLVDLTVAHMAAGAVVLESEGVGSNDSDSMLPTAAAVKDYVDTQDAAIASDTLTFTNKTFDAAGSGNALSNVAVSMMAAAAVVLESEGIGSNDNDTTLPTSAAVKDYVDTQLTAMDLDFQGDSGGALSIDLDSETLTLAGGTGLDSSGSGNTITFAIDSTVCTLTGSQTLTNKTLVAPALGTPASGNLANCTALPAAQVSQGTMASGMVMVAPVLGTPASGNLANCTAYPGDSSLVAAGALNSGSISDGFGNIDIGSSTLDAGKTTLAESLLLPKNMEVGFTGFTASGMSTNGFAYISGANALSYGDANDATKSQVIGIWDAGDSKIVAMGPCLCVNSGGVSAGDALYLSYPESGAAGHVTSTAPNASGDVILHVGYAMEDASDGAAGQVFIKIGIPTAIV